MPCIIPEKEWWYSAPQNMAAPLLLHKVQYMWFGLKVHWWLNISRTKYGRAQHLLLHRTDLLNHRGAFAVTVFHWRSSGRPSEDICVPLLHEHLSCQQLNCCQLSLCCRPPLKSCLWPWEFIFPLKGSANHRHWCPVTPWLCKTLIKQPSWAKTVAKHKYHLQKLWTCVF